MEQDQVVGGDMEVGRLDQPQQAAGRGVGQGGQQAGGGQPARRRGRGSITVRVEPLSQPAVMGQFLDDGAGRVIAMDGAGAPR